MMTSPANASSATPKAVIFGLSGTVLTQEEATFLQEHNPLGIILFARNIHDKAQCVALVEAIKKATGRPDTLILIDQEGGRVMRIRPPHFREVPQAAMFQQLAEHSLEDAKKASYYNGYLLGKELLEWGVNVDCAPVADLRMPGAHDIIGNRSFGNNPDQVALLARAMAEGLHDGGVLSIVKHIPGHGRALVDSHEALPYVNTDLATLEATDFAAFQHLKDLPWAMTAHIIYEALDKNLPATLSPTVLSYIRSTLGFNGLIVSDDIMMKALSAPYAHLAVQCLQAGCDIVLHCSGEMTEMKAIAPVVPALTKEALARLARAQALVNKPTKEESSTSALEKLEAYLAPLAKQSLAS